MTFKCFPTAVEIYDETGDHIATVKSFDECAAELDFKSLLGRDNFDEMIGAIREAVWMVTEPLIGADKTGEEP